jgi:predicted dehydrogenase
MTDATPSDIDIGHVENGRVIFPNWRGESDRPAPAPAAFMPPAERVGFAVVGLGRLSLEEILPAFGAAKKARLVAVMSQTPAKARAVGAQYGIAAENIFGYGDWDRIAAKPDIKAVYIVTPNARHRDDVLAAAQAGKHVLCEKPMATGSAEARAMVAACEGAGVKLMIAYRCQYEPYNRRVMDLIRSGEYGRARLLEACNTQTQGPADQWRMKGAMAGGGALPDIGLYCLNGVRAYTGEEPVEVFSRIWSPPGDARFATVEDTVTFTLRFPSGVLANCATSYTAHESREMRVRLAGASVELSNAFAYVGQSLKISHRQGNGEVAVSPAIPHANQFALELDHFAACVLTGRTPRTPGEEGVQDHLIMEAIYDSARTGQPVALPEITGLDVFRGPALEG